MANRPAVSVENNFTKGLVSEFTGLNFPENAATDTDNCTYTLVGDVTRRLDIDTELNGTHISFSSASRAINTYKWDNAGGDGTVQLVVTQSGSILNFWRSSSATTTNPVSWQKLVSQVDLSTFVASGGSFDQTLECQFTDGNGYLFVFHPNCDPIYCTYNAGTITGTAITVQIRDLDGIPDGLATTVRPPTLSVEHQYNIVNQGWIKGAPWSGTSTSVVLIATGIRTFTTQAGLTVNIGDLVSCYNNNGGALGFQLVMWGVVTGYAATTLTVNIGAAIAGAPGASGNNWQLIPTQTGFVDTFKTVSGSYPSNFDVWWYFKNPAGAFDPTTTINNVTISSGRAPQGHFILNAFQQLRSTVSGIAGITDITTTQRPTNGCWFQGRVWYTGLNATQQITGDAPYYTWTENIYFSKAIVNGTNFGECFSENDQTSENLFGLLPTDGGVIVLQGSGPIFKLFPIQNGLLVFAANGVWFITGSQGIGFAATDYTITNISHVRSISSTSYVDVEGLPYFWNEDGIYAVQPQQGGGLGVNIITYQTIDSFYNEIPIMSKKYVRGDYDPINYTIQWLYRETNEAGLVDRYTFNKILNYNTANKAFFPYTIAAATTRASGITYVTYPGGTSSPPPAFKYFATSPSFGFCTFAEEHVTTYKDWTVGASNATNYESYFITGYKLHGQGQRRFQMPYVYMYSRNEEDTSYKIQSLWDYATSGNSGRWSTAQLINISKPNFGMVFRRHRLRGQGLVLQIKVKSVDGEPFDIMGWSAAESQNSGP